MAYQHSVEQLKERFAQQTRARIPFNPVDGVDITGANVERLKVGMETFGWSDYRFVTKEQARDNNWSIKKDSDSVRVTIRNADNGSLAEKTLFNAQDVRGMPTLDEMLDMSEVDMRKMRGEPLQAPASKVQPQASIAGPAPEIPEVDGAASAGTEVEDEIVIGPALQPEKLVSIDSGPNTPSSELPVEKAVRDLFLDAPVGMDRLQSPLGQEVPSELLEQQVKPAREQPTVTGFAVMAPYWLDGLHNHEGVELAKQVNRLIEARRLAEDKAAIATLLNSYPDRRRLGLDIVSRSNYLNDPHHKANVSQPVQLLGGELVRDKEGAYRPKAGGAAVVQDKGTSLVLKTKTEHAYRGAMELALAKGWKAIELKGKPKMLAQAWVEAQMMGLEVVNYTPTEKDREQLAQRMAETAKKRETAAARAEQLVPETVEVRPVVDAAGKEVMATMTYTVARADLPPMEFDSPKGAAKAYLESITADEPVVTRTVTRVDGVVRADVIAGVATMSKGRAGKSGSARPGISTDVVDHEFEAALSEAKQEQGAVQAVDGVGQEKFDLEKGGRLVAHGPAPYDHNPNNKLNYYATLEGADGQTKKVWGKDLERSIADAGAQLGDKISLAENERKSVEVEENGRWKTAHFVSWKTTVLSRAPEVEQVASASNTPGSGLYIGPIVHAENGRVAQKTGRDPNKLVWHDVSKLQGKVPAVGDHAEISYAMGVGHVKEREHAQELVR